MNEEKPDENPSSLKRSKKICPGNGKCYTSFNQKSDYSCSHDCKLVECKNHPFCKQKMPQWKFDESNLCSTCSTIFDDVLEFKTDKDYECPVCYTHDNHLFMKFPTCSHCFCVRCMRVIILFDETRYHLSPVPYGCPPCPNECENPIKGRQCFCEEYNDLIDLWEEMFPESYNRWRDDEDESILEANDPVYGSKKCPVCRTTF